MNYKEKYNEWLNSKVISESVKEELRGITDEKELEDRFYNGFTVKGIYRGYDGLINDEIKTFSTENVSVSAGAVSVLVYPVSG